MSVPKKDVEPETDIAEEDEEPSLPEVAETPGERGDEEDGSLADGRAAILHHAKIAPSQPGVYRMIDARGDVLYVGKAKNVKNRVRAYARPAGLDTRIERMIAATRALEFVVTRTETEALLLEANLIKRLRPRFNVLLRDDKSFPYILITGDHWAPQIVKHRGARTRAGPLFRTVRLGVGGQPHHQRAAARLPAALVQRSVLREPHPAVPAASDQALLGAVHQRSRLRRVFRTGARGRRLPLRPQPGGQGRAAAEMEAASFALDFERAAVYRDRLAALSAIPSHQGINPRGVEEADVFALHQHGGFACVEVFFFRTGRTGATAHIFRAPTSPRLPARCFRIPRPVL